MTSLIRLRYYSSGRLVIEKGAVTLPGTIDPNILPEPDPGWKWIYFPNDYELASLLGSPSYWTIENNGEKNFDGKARGYPYENRPGKPGTVATYYKDDFVTMTPAWQRFAFRQFVFSVFGHFDETRLEPDALDWLKGAWASTMAGNRVITNGTYVEDGYQDVITGANPGRPYFKYMNLCMCGNVGQAELRDDGTESLKRPNNKIGVCYVVKCLDGRGDPPDPRDVNYIETPHLIQVANIQRYDGVDGYGWQRVDPFHQLNYRGHVPLLNISNRPETLVPVLRVYTGGDPHNIEKKLTRKPNPYNPPVDL